MTSSSSSRTRFCAEAPRDASCSLLFVRSPASAIALSSVVLGLVGLPSCAPTPPAAAPVELADDVPLADDVWGAAERLMLQEEVLLLVVENLRGLKRDLLDLKVGGRFSRDLFAQSVRVTGIESVGAPTPHPELPPHLRISAVPVTTGPRSEHPRHALDPLGPLLREFTFLDLASAHVPRGWFLDDEATRFRSAIDLELRGDVGGETRYARVQFDLDWVLGAVPVVGPQDKPLPAVWTIEAWTHRSAEVSQVAEPLFTEVLNTVLPDPAQRDAARRSLHEALVIEMTEKKRGFHRPPYFDPASHDRHPAVAVADVNGDGLDDVYLSARLGPNQLLLAQPDGTFVESAARLGLAIDGHTAAPLFVDLDNDGDLDAFLGRTLARSQLLIQGPDGRFTDRPDLSSEPLPMTVSSVSAADVNRDGLLDLYVSTYSLHSGRNLDDSLPSPDPEREQQMLADHHVIHNAYGPANLLLLNQGGARLARSEGAPLIFRHSYQSTFADWDADGDADLYVVNDYAPNVALRNRGDGTFEDATAELGMGDLGFGMGASFGDYDQDGQQDLYVSNMFSNAGRRATRSVPGLDERFAKMARGNTLMRNLGDGFAAVSGLEPPALLVEKTGWSWGGRFVDVDNDGAEDLAVLNGYFTAPDRVAQPVDI